MKKIAILLVYLGAALCTHVAVAQQPSLPFLFGVWEGAMTVIPERAEGGAPAVFPFEGQAMPLSRLNIRKTNLVLYFQGPDGSLQQMGEQLDFRLNEQGRSAVVIIALQPQGEGGPTETWMVNIARWDEETIAVHVSRVTSGSGDAAQPPVSFAAFGQMRKVANEG